MRVTGNTFVSMFLNQANRLEARQYALQEQAATGQRIRIPADDPTGMQRTLNLQGRKSSLDQYAHNIAVLQERATSSFASLKTAMGISNRAGELATLADGTSSPEELQAYATEVTQLIQQAVQAMNATYDGNYLFGGTLSDQPPFVLSMDADGHVTGVTYQGNASVASRDIDEGASITVDAPGANTSGTGARGVITDSRSGADFFNHLISLQNHLLAGDTDAIASDDLPALGLDEENLLYHISNNGAVQTRLEATATSVSARALAVDGMISQEAGADLTETLTQLSQAQTAYQAALQSASSILGTSLLDYL